MASLSPPPVLPRLMGTWYLSYSTLDVWKNKGVPRCELSELNTSNGVVSWTDAVWVKQRGWFSATPKLKPLVATDTLTGEDPIRFRWMGRGWLRFINSDCQLLAHDPDCTEYAVVHFGPTWFTEAGVDVMTRAPDGLPQQRLEKVVAGLEPAMQQLAKLRGLSWTGEVAGDK